MNILIEGNVLAQPHLTGVGYYTKYLTEALAAAEPSNRLTVSNLNFLGRHPIGPEHLTLADNLHVRNNYLVPNRVYSSLYWKASVPPYDLLVGSRPDVVIFPNYVCWPTAFAKFKVVTIYDLSFLRYPQYVDERNLAYLTKVVPRAVADADLILTDSETVRQEIAETFKRNPATILATPIPPDRKRYYRLSKPDRSKLSKYGIDSPYILFVSTLEPRKNIVKLIEAYQLLPEHVRKTYSLVLAGGKGWQDQELTAAIEAGRKAGHQIIVTGYFDQADATELYNNASILVAPSVYEGFGMQIAEAIACETPVLANDIPVFHEVAGEGALFADADNPDAFAVAMQQLLEDNELRRRLIQNGLEHLAAFTWDNNAQAVLAKLQEMLNKI